MQRHGAQALNRLGQARPFFVGELAGTQIALVHAANRADDTHRQLSRAHFHREDRHRQPLIERHVLGNVHRKRGLAHGRTRGQHHQIARLQAAGHAVQIGKTRGDAGHVHRVIGLFLNVVQQVDHQRIERLKALLVARAFFANRKNLGLGLVKNAPHRAALRIKGVGGNLVAGRHQLAQNRALAHDFGIAADVAGAGHILRQRVQINQPAHLLRLAQRLQLLMHRDHVRRLAGIHQRRNGSEDQLVLVAVEIALLEQIPHPIPGHVVQQQPAQHTRLGLHRMRRNPQLRHLAIRRIRRIIGGETWQNCRHSGDQCTFRKRTDDASRSDSDCHWISCGQACEKQVSKRWIAPPGLFPEYGPRSAASASTNTSTPRRPLRRDAQPQTLLW
ncbi:hypothetical protein SDC9_110397 [bioreactor metagenome]|uniref:Uncharacterized protein n=1 Tax=bioreactor metagenome TaxID=1076179 RepID=A0A645BDV8_9ZZZZ